MPTHFRIWSECLVSNRVAELVKSFDPAMQHSERLDDLRYGFERKILILAKP